MTTPITVKTFNAKLASSVKSATTLRDNLQDLLEFGLVHTREQGDTVYLTKTLNACIGVKALPTKLMLGYIKGHVNVKWVKAKDGNMTFKKDGKTLKVKDINGVWYEFNNEHQAKAECHPMTQLKSWLTRTEKAIKEGLVKDSDEMEKSLEAMNNVKSLLA